MRLSPPRKNYGGSTPESARYDGIGINYSELRKPDLRIASAIEQALGDAKNILNVGAGTGSYEPQNRAVTAVELSADMIRQRKPGKAKIVQASAEDLPFETEPSMLRWRC